MSATIENLWDCCSSVCQPRFPYSYWLTTSSRQKNSQLVAILLLYTVPPGRIAGIWEIWRQTLDQVPVGEEAEEEEI